MRFEVEFLERVGEERMPLGAGRAEIKIGRDKEQFCTGVDTYKLNMFRLAKSILHDDNDAEDAMSEAVTIKLK